MVDYFGLFGFPARSLPALKLVGVALVFAGAVTIQMLNQRDMARVRPALRLMVLPSVLSVASIHSSKV